MTFAVQPFSTVPFSTTGDERVVFIDFSPIEAEVSFEFKIYVANKTGFATLPTDRLASQPFRAVLQSFSFESDILGDEIGVFTRGHGSLIIANQDTHYDYVAPDYTIEGQPIVVKAAVRDGSYDAAYTVWNVTATGWNIDADNVSIDVIDKGYMLDVPMQETLYAGTGGKEGGSDLSGKRKPRAFGYARNIPAPEVEPNYHTFQVNDGPVENIVAVYVRGAALTKGSDYANYAALKAATIPAGNFATCLAEGFFRLHYLTAEDVGAVTADVEGDNRDGYVETTADIARWAIRNCTALTDPDDLEAQTFAIVNTEQPAVIDYWIGPDDSLTVKDFIANIMGGIGGWGGFNPQGLFEVRLFKEPTGAPVQRFARADMLEDLRREPLPSAYNPPPWRIRVPYARNWTVQTDLAGSVSDDHRAFASQAVRLAEYSNAAIKVDHRFAQDREPVQAYFSELAPAAVEAERRSHIGKATRNIYRFTAPRRALRLRLGDVIMVTHPRFGLSLGRLMTVVELGHDISGSEVIRVRVAAYG